MRAPRAHTVVLVVLATIGLSAAGVGWYCVTRSQVLASTHEVAAGKIDALVERASRLDAAFESFESRGIDYSWFTATSRLVEDLHARAAELDSTLPGVAMAPRARLAEDLQRVRETVDGARANLDAGQTLMALDVMESNGKPASAAVGAELPALRAAVATEIAALQRRWWQRVAGAGGAWAVTWAVGLLWFSRRRVPAESLEERTALFGLPSLAESGAVEAAAACPAGRPAGAGAGRGGGRVRAHRTRARRIRVAGPPRRSGRRAARRRACSLDARRRRAGGRGRAWVPRRRGSAARTRAAGRRESDHAGLAQRPVPDVGRTQTRGGERPLPRRLSAPPVLLVSWPRSCRRTRTSVRLSQGRGLSRRSSQPCLAKREPTPTRMPATRPL